MRGFAWCMDNRHIVYPQDTGGDENWHLHLVDPDDGADCRRHAVRRRPGTRSSAADRDQPHLILVGLNRDNPELHDAYMLDVRDGSLDLVAEEPRLRRAG